MGAPLQLRCPACSLRRHLLWNQALRGAGFRSCDVWALEHRLGSCGVWAWLPCGMWHLPGPGLEPMSPASAGGLFPLLLGCEDERDSVKRLFTVPLAEVCCPASSVPAPLAQHSQGHVWKSGSHAREGEASAGALLPVALLPGKLWPGVSGLPDPILGPLRRFPQSWLCRPEE